MPLSYIELDLLLGTALRQIAELSAGAELLVLETVLSWLLRLE